MDSDGYTREADTDFYAPEPGSNPVEQDSGSELSVSWTAFEFMHHQKTASWYVSAAAILASTGIVSYLLMRELFGTVAVLVLGVILLVSANRKPRTLEYLVDNRGIVAGNKEYSYADFQSFSIIQEDSIESILLTSQKRWSPPLSLYFEPKDAQKIFDVLSEHLPLEKRDKDSLDKFLHTIRF